MQKSLQTPDSQHGFGEELAMRAAGKAEGWPSLYVGRPVNGEENSQRTIFKIIDNGKEAEQVRVEYGRASVSAIQVLSGLKPGDRVILAYKTADDPQGFTGMFAYEQFNRLEIK